MAFNRKERLRDNIEAIRTVFTLENQQRAATPREREILGRFCGFGGLKCILNPAASLMDAAQWTKFDRELFPLTAELHRLIRDNSKDEREYKRYFDSLKSSVLTAFYTPPEVVAVLAATLHDNGITPHRLLDPSAGQGVFISAFGAHAPGAEVMAFDKDLLTGKLLSYLYPQHKVRAEGFERIEKPFTNYFDVATSNIPFGDVAVFDPEYTGAGNYPRRAAAKTIHNYFFLKSLDAVRNGGIVAFITSQGVMNAREGAIRMEMLKHADLVSAVRLPNNLFTDHAGTEVGSDLIILQKNERKQAVSEMDKLFAGTAPNDAGFVTNTYFQKYPERIVSTREKTDTDPYGKPAMVYLHEGGVTGIAGDMRKILSEDFANRLNVDLYHGMTSRQVEQASPSVSVHQEPIPVDRQEAGEKMPENERKFRNEQPSQPEDQQRNELKSEPVKKEEKPKPAPPVMDLYDLFNFTQAERRTAQSGQKKKQAGKKARRTVPVSRNLFDQPTVDKEQKTAAPS